MAVTDAHDLESGDEQEESMTLISALRTSPDRIVFTENGNADGWIATDHTVSLSQ